MVRVTPRLSFKLKFVNNTQYFLILYAIVSILHVCAEQNHLKGQ
jgi:hypothetical protein